ncbi:MAG: metallophosphoesterase [Bacteroidetes bacterium]|nr:metallophosphoesterase [Bacteroidota bacterium]MBU1678172.1 metallophosphoesterase [Bacteroidota bacterium]MBU2506704.1 metallophosphoesterase [Bacteroidota bacterium]
MIAVIGDIHGCYYTLIELFNKIKVKYQNIPLYCVGDMVDRGNHSFEVMKFVISEGIKFTPGNHDYMFLYFFKDPTSIFARSWVFNGSETTLESYESHEDDVFKHIEVIKNAPLFFDTSDCLITHAGISKQYEKFLPGDFKSNHKLVTEAIIRDFKNDFGVLWARGDLLDIGKLQVVGHTKQQEIILDEKANAVYIDTGACVGNKLSAVIIHENQITDVLEAKTNLNDII